MQPFNFIIILCVILLLQIIFTFIQVKRYQAHIKTVITKYDSDIYKLYVKTIKISRLSKAVVLLVIDNQHIIRECAIMSGISVISRFKPVPVAIGQNYDELLIKLQNNINSNSKQKNKASKTDIALLNFLSQINYDNDEMN